MAKIQCKGTVLEQELAMVLTAVAQVISLDHSGAESETYEADTLDNADAGIPYEPTGRTEGGTIDGELFYDPALAGHQALTDLLTTPAKQDWNITFADAGATDMPFTGAGISFGITVALADGLKSTFSIKIDKLATYST